ncbi:MAG: YtxH domain-containing protein [Alkalibacterium sp.]
MSKKSFGTGAILGALAGAAAAYLFAPKSGQEFQDDMKLKAKEAKEKAIIRMDEAVMETEIWLDQQLSEQDIRNQPVKYERTPKNVAEAPVHAYTDDDTEIYTDTYSNDTYTESPDVFIEE